MVKVHRANTLLLGVIASVLIGWVLHVGAPILKPIVIAFLLASMLQPFVILLARKGIPPVLTVVLMVWLLFLGLVQVGLLFNASVTAFLFPNQPAAISDLEGMSESQKEAMEKAGGWEGIVNGIEERLERTEVADSLKSYGRKALEDLRNIDLKKFAGDLALGGFGFITNVVLVLIYMVFIFAEQAVFRRKILAIAGDRQEQAAEVLDTIGRGIQRYLGVKTVVSFLTGALCTLGLVALEVPYALLFGFLTFLLNYIPTFGSIVAGVFPTVTALAVEEHSLVTAIAVVVLYLAVNLTLGSFIEPRILGRELNLSPLVVVISVVVWGGLWGIVGGFLAVPLTSALQICLASQETTRPIAVMLGSGPPRERRRSRKAASGGEESDETPEVAA